MSKLSGFGHTIDVEAENPTVHGEIFNGVYSLETAGGLTVRLSSGTVRVDKVKSVDLDPIAGQGFELRRCGEGTSTITNSRFVGRMEGAFIRECSDVVFANNAVSGMAGDGIVTREAESSADQAIVIRDNTVFESLNGIVCGRESLSEGGLVISGNRISDASCGVGRSSRETTIDPYTSVAALAAGNTFVNVSRASCTVE